MRRTVIAARRARTVERLAARIALKFAEYLNPWETSGEDWYRRAVAQIRDEFGDRADDFAAILAATSPQCDVGHNVKLARDELDRRKRGLPVKAWLPCHAKNLERLRNNEPLRGLKVVAFARALQGDVTAVVVDTWMLRASGIPERRFKTAPAFRAVYRAIEIAAAAAGIPNTEAQARIWFAYRAKNWIARKGPGDGYLPL